MTAVQKKVVIKMPKAFKKIWNVITTVLVTAVALCVVFLVFVRLAGIKPYAVLSGSMEPEYPVGSLLYVKKVDTDTLRVGDDITFMLDEDTLATHRIIEIVPDGDNTKVIRFRTKGIANEYADNGLVHCKNIVGKPIFDIPYLGYVSYFIQKPPGIYIAVAGGAIILLMAFLPDLFGAKRKKSGKNPQDNTG